MLLKVDSTNAIELYDYFIKNRSHVPYYFDVNFEDWQKSMFNDTDYDGKPLFRYLETYMLINGDKITGFIQFGLTNFTFDKGGNKDYTQTYPIIRNLHYLPDAKDFHSLIYKANEFFISVNHNQRYAFFHYFGMSCFARQGKLHYSQIYIENLLNCYGYEKEHENVYYTKYLSQNLTNETDGIHFLYKNNEECIDFIFSGKRIGGCELFTTFNPHICFLKWIYIEHEYTHQGFGTKCMYKLFRELKKKGFVRLDTDTTDNNINAQAYYQKTGFQDKGRMRSYYTKEDGRY